MPSHTSYTPFETLKFCQLICQYGGDQEAFVLIAKDLNDIALIRESDGYDAKRFTADALQDLYNNLIHQEGISAQKVNGDVSAIVSRKRKASASPQPNGVDEEGQFQALVDKLYARFREETIKEIRREEEEYERLQNTIEELEKAEAAENAQPVSSQTSSQGAQQPPLVTDNVPAKAQSQPTSAQIPAHAPTQPVQPPGFNAHPPAINSVPQQHQQSAPYGMNAPSPIPGRPNGPPPPGPPQPGFPHIPPGQPRPPYQQGMPPPMDYGPRRTSSATSTPARGSPIPQAPQQYPPYQHYQPPPQWPQHYPPQQQYPQPMGYPNQGYYGQPPTGRQQSPYQQPYAPYPQSAPMHYQPPHGWHSSPSHSPFPQQHSAFSTPGQAVSQRAPPRTPGSSTPWKHRSIPPANSQRPFSPVRPDRSISPVSDTEAVDKPQRSSTRSAAKAATPKREVAPARRGRPPSVAASGRSQSVASQTPEAPGDNERKAVPVKIEAPNTPQPTSTDNEQRSSGRRGHPRNSVSATAAQSDSLRTTTNKRKRSSPVPESATPPPDRPVPGRKSTLYSSDPSLVLVSKNFAKTAQLVLNEINSHKLGGVFAKPLTERDAPGYKDVILRPQDLKSIKTSVNKGSRAAITAIEALDLPEDEKNETAEEYTKDAEGQGAVGNGFYLIKKSEDLEPPKGIVNAAQLEMELMRVFANAIMFNPLPRAERGFGWNLRLRKRGGDRMSRERDHIPDSELPAEEADPTEEGSTSSEDLESAEYTGIIADAREMFEDVRKQFETWRELENERRKVDLTGNDPGYRQGSVGSVPPEEHNNTSSSTPIASKEKDPAPEEGRGTLRKRRKLAAD